MDDVQELKRLSTTTSEEIDRAKLDRVYNEILLPLFKRHAKNFKTNKVRITENIYCAKAQDLMRELFGREYTVQSIVETEMKPYLQGKGYKVILWSPSYSVEVAW